MNNKVVIIPGSDDKNRGDQALVWETSAIIKQVLGEDTAISMISSIDCCLQSVNQGIVVIDEIIKHPSRVFKSSKSRENKKFSKAIKLKWGVVAFFDLLSSILLLIPGLRKFFLLFRSKNTKATYNSIKQADYIFVKGGGFIHCYNNSPVYLYRLYYQLFHIKLAISLGKKVIIMPNSFGPFVGNMNRRFIKKTLSKVALIYSRESISQQALENELGIESNVARDLGFYLGKSDSNMADITVNKIKTLAVFKKIVGITVRPYRFEGFSDSEKRYENYIDSMVNFAKWIIAENYFPVFIEQVYNANYHEKDIAAITEVTEKLLDGEYYIVSDINFNCENLKYIYSNCDYVVGTRFHSVIFSLSEKVPSIAITYGGNKGDGIMKDLHLDEYAIKMSEVAYEILIDKFVLMVNNTDKYKSVLQQIVESNIDNKQRIITELEGLYGKSISIK